MKSLLDNKTTELVVSTYFTKKHKFKLRRLERLIYIRKIDSIFNKKGPIKYIVDTNILYKEHREKRLILQLKS